MLQQKFFLKLQTRHYINETTQPTPAIVNPELLAQNRSHRCMLETHFLMLGC